MVKHWRTTLQEMLDAGLSTKEIDAIQRLEAGHNVIEIRKKCSTLRQGLGHIRDAYTVIWETNNGYCIVRPKGVTY